MSRVAVWLALAVLLAVAGIAVAATPHAPIRIEGDAGFCAPGSGVVNCDEADGSPEMPYRIAGWAITATPSLQPLCGQDVHAAVAVCGTDAHVVLADLELDVPAAAPLDSGPDGPAVGTAIHLYGSGNVTMDRVRIETAGRALHVEDDPAKHRQRPMPPVSVTGSRLTSTAPSAISLIRAVNADISLAGTEIDAAGRINAIHTTFLDDADGRHAPQLRLHAVHLSGAAIQGVQAQGGHVDVRDSTLSIEAPATSLPGPAGGLQVAVLSLLDGASAHVEGNSFAFTGTAVELSDAAEVLVRGNRFAGGPDDAAMEVARDGHERPCAVQADYNDVGLLRIVNHAEDCVVLAPHNWWGGKAPASEQLDGLIDVSAWSPVRLDAMPRVTLDAAPASSGGRLLLEGSVTGPAVRLELAGGWTGAREVSPGRFRWDVSLEESAVGLLDLRLHGCSTVVCGPPLEWQLQRLPAPLPPVAMVTLSPSVVEPGAPVVLDASGSFSPQDTPITAYRFDDGAWSAQPTHTVRPSVAGTLAVTVVVQDADGRTSKPVVASVHVRAPVASQVDAPLPGLALAVVAIALAAAGRPR